MKNNILAIFIVWGALGLCACQNKTAEQSQETAQDTTKVATDEKPLSQPQIADQTTGDFCFLKTEGKDTTLVKLRLLGGGDVRGEMIWQPWQKDGAVGNLNGQRNSQGEYEIIYDYTIEGSRQTETKIMKIENDKLMIKTGELTDPKNDGNLQYKDATKAQYTEVLTLTECN